MKKSIITGITGQDGEYLAQLLLKKGYIIFTLIRSFFNLLNYEIRFYPIKIIYTLFVYIFITFSILNLSEAHVFSIIRVIDIFFIFSFLFVFYKKIVFYKNISLLFLLIFIPNIFLLELSFLFRFVEYYMIVIVFINYIKRYNIFPIKFIILNTFLVCLFYLLSNNFNINPYYLSLNIIFLVIYIIERNKKNYYSLLLFFFIFMLLYMFIKGVLLFFIFYLMFKIKSFFKNIKLFMIVLIGIFIAFFSSVEMQDKTNKLFNHSIETTANLQRVYMAQNAFYTIKSFNTKELLFGLGNNYHLLISKNYENLEKYISSGTEMRIHNDYFSMLIGYGLFGTIYFMLIFFIMYNSSKEFKIYSLMIYGSALFNTFFYIGSGFLSFFFIILAFSYGMKNRSYSNEK
jgi:hypothetical protein